MAVVVVVSILHYYPRMGVQIRTQRHHILQRIPWMVVVMVALLLLLVMHMMAICVGFRVRVNNATTRSAVTAQVVLVVVLVAVMAGAIRIGGRSQL